MHSQILVRIKELHKNLRNFGLKTHFVYIRTVTFYRSSEEISLPRILH